ANVMAAKLAPMTFATISAADYRTVLNPAITAAKAAADQAKPPIDHPLDPALRAVAKGWLRLTLPAAVPGEKPRRLRIATFNAVPVTNAETATNEIIGIGTGRPGQQYALAHRNVLAGSLDLAMQEDTDPATPLVNWLEARDLDEIGPFESAFELD